MVIAREIEFEGKLIGQLVPARDGYEVWAGDPRHVIGWASDNNTAMWLLMDHYAQTEEGADAEV